MLIAAKHLHQHNAGNDASYTLRVMVAIALDESLNRRNAEESEIEKRNRMEAACKAVRAGVCTISQGWSEYDPGRNSVSRPSARHSSNT